MPRRVASPGALAALMGGIVGSQFAATLGASLIPIVGPFVVVALRQTVAAVSLAALGRPRLGGRRWPEIWPAVLLGAAMAIMNNAVYLSIARLGVGLTITLEFVGPLVVALTASRRLGDALCALAAAGGVALLALGPVRVDPLGLLLGLVGASAWASYILLNRRVGRDWSGIQGAAVAAIVCALLSAPIGFATLGARPLGLHVVLIGAIAGLLSSAVPAAIDMVVLRRIEPRVYGLLMSVNPVVAALLGWLVNGRALAPLQWLAIVVISAASGVALGRPARGPGGSRRSRRRTPAPQLGDDAV